MGTTKRNGITAITCTGGRPEAFGLCCEYIGRQTRKPDQWIIVDDGQPHMAGRSFYSTSRIPFEYIRREPQPGEGHTLRQNLLAAIPHIEFDKIVFFEDDDWYSPLFIESFAEKLETFSLVGEYPAKYYNVRTGRYRVCKNNGDRASLCQTGIRAEFLDRLIWQINSKDSHFVDHRLWHDPVIGADDFGRCLFTASTSSSWAVSDDGILEHCSPEAFRGDFDNPVIAEKPRVVSRTESLCIGIKGLPGRAGIGIGHRLGPNEKTDHDGTILREWIGDDAARYSGFLRPAQT